MLSLLMLLAVASLPSLDVAVSGDRDGTLCLGLMGQAEPQATVLAAHEGMLLNLAWHPLGHLLASGEASEGGGGHGLRQVGRVSIMMMQDAGSWYSEVGWA